MTMWIQEFFLTHFNHGHLYKFVKGGITCLNGGLHSSEMLLLGQRVKTAKFNESTDTDRALFKHFSRIGTL